MNDTLSLINRLTSKKYPLVRLYLVIKSQASNSIYFYVPLMLVKFLGLLILSLNFSINLERSYNYKITSLVRNFTTFGIFSSYLTYNYYLGISIISLIILCFFSFYILSFYRQIKLENDFLLTKKAENSIYYIKILVHLLLVFNQHLLEFLSFIFIMVFNTTNNPNYVIFSYLNNNSLKYSSAYFLMFINLISIILLNIFIYFSFQILNEPFFDTKFPLNFKYPQLSDLYFIYISNMQCINYIELFISNTDTLKIYKISIFISINLPIIMSYIRSYSMFNFSNLIVHSANFLFSFSFFSSLFELILFLTNNIASDFNGLLNVFICKLLLSISYLIADYLLKRKYFSNECRSALFKNYDGKISNSELESLFYMINLLVKFKNEDPEALSKLMDIIIIHKAECGLEFCRCNLITKFKTLNLTNEINFIIQEIFTGLNLGRFKMINILFSEYIFFMKNSVLFSYALLNTYINKNCKSVSCIEISQFYVLLFKKILKYDEHLILNNEYVNFNNVFKHFRQKQFYEKKILSYIVNFETFVSFKENFDNTLKIDHENSILNSIFFEENINTLVENCENNKKIYKQIKKNIKDDFSINKCKSIELSYKIYMFFLIFNKKVPLNIGNILCLESDHEVYSASDVHIFFDKIFIDYFSENNKPMNIIIEINKIFKIKYFSDKLSQIIGFDHNYLIGKDFHQLLPPQLRDAHKKILIDFFLIRRQKYFFKKTYIFTNNNNFVPINLKVTLFPNLGKHLQAVLSVSTIPKTPNTNFRFILSEDYNLISLSENLDEIYSINYNLIDNLGITVLKLFDIQDIIPNKFKSQFEVIAQFKKRKQMDSLYSLSHFLFNLNYGDESYVDENYNEKIFSKVSIGNNKQGISSDNSVKNKNKLEADQTKNQVISFTDQGIKDIEKENTLENKSNLTEPNFKTKSKLAKPSRRTDNNSNLNTNLKKKISNNSLNGPYEYIRDGPNFSRSSNEQKKNSKKLINSFINGSETDSKKTFNTNIRDEIENDYNGNLTNRSLNDENSFYVYRDKKIVVKILEQVQNKSKDMDIANNFHEKLSQAINSIRKSFYGIDSFGQNYYNETYKIKISFRKINDTPFFIISVKEKIINNKASKILQLKRDLSLVNETSEINYNKKDTNKFKTLSKVKPSLDKIKSSVNLANISQNKLELPITKDVMSSFESKSYKSKINENIKTDSINIFETSNSKLDSKMNFLTLGIRKQYQTENYEAKTQATSNEQEILFRKKEKISKKKQQRQISIFNLILCFLLFLNIILTCVIFIMKIYLLDTNKSLFLINFWNRSQHFSFISLHSAIISLLLTLNNLTTFDTQFLIQNGTHIEYANFQELLNDRVLKYRHDFSTFLQSIQSNQIQSTELDSLLYNHQTFDKALITWQNIKFNDTFAYSVDYICSNSQILSKEKDFSDLIYDFNTAFLFNKYTQNSEENIEQKSQDSKLIYFLNTNFNLLNSIINNLEASISKLNADFNNTWRQIVFVLEIMSIVMSFFLIFVIYYVLNKFDNPLFHTLISMFLNLRKGNDLTFKSPVACSIIKLKIKSYKELVQMFTKENIIKIDKHIIQENSLNSYEILSNQIAYNNLCADSADDKELNILSNTNQAVNRINNKFKAIEKNKISSIIQLGNINSINDPNISSSIAALNFNKSSNLNLSQSHKHDEQSTTKIKKDKFKKIDHDRSEIKNYENELPKDDNVTNGHILTKIKISPIKFIKFAKILITIIFFIYIFFVIFSLVTNTLNLQQIDQCFTLTNSLMNRFPAITMMFNLLRLMIIEKNIVYTDLYNDNMSKFTKADSDRDVLVNSYQNILPTTINYVNILNSVDYSAKIKTICNDIKYTYVCALLLNEGNGFNKGGNRLAYRTTTQALNNIYNDYLYLTSSGDRLVLDSLATKETIRRYFYNEDFANINLEIEYVFIIVDSQYSQLILNDMTNVFSQVINLNLLLGIISIYLNLLIIIFVVFVFFNRLKKNINDVSYATKKFNKVLYNYDY